MSQLFRFSAIVAPVDFAEADGKESTEDLVVDAGSHRVAFSAATVRAVDLAYTLARDSGAKLHLLHAIPPMQSGNLYSGPVSVPSKIIDEIHERARVTSLAAMRSLQAERCSDADVEIVVTLGKPLGSVLEHARTTSADLIVMAASGRSRVARFFVGTTADRIIREAVCPVLVVPPKRE